eukprot:SAG22_NODE_2766_length_2228_cov_1.450446_2_plen_58_part_00
MLGRDWPTWDSLAAVSPQVQRMLEEHKVEFTRIAQLAVRCLPVRDNLGHRLSLCLAS